MTNRHANRVTASSIKKQIQLGWSRCQEVVKFSLKLVETFTENFMKFSITTYTLYLTTNLTITTTNRACSAFFVTFAVRMPSAHVCIHTIKVYHQPL